MIKKLFAIFIITALPLGVFAFDASEVERAFMIENEEAVTDIIITSGYADYDFEVKTAAGRYRMKRYKISHYKDNIYILYINFCKKDAKPKIDMIEEIPFWYNGKKIVFLTKKGKIKYKIPSKKKMIIKKLQNGNFAIIEKPAVYKIKLPSSSGTLHLALSFE
ncbi:hypothetical protein [Nitrosophilus alvini]|uniref:hypothetical protein n=1 Tax=Nitrosophilus alvini TaxID=2714855 RepID=UPI00190CCB04|nr:hypothetical protein [Nitrosophilus alvini]